VKQLAIPPGNQKTVAKWLVITQQNALHSHLTKLANYANQAIGYSLSTDKTPSHSNKLPTGFAQPFGLSQPSGWL
jgi:hypothetical protein